MKNGTNDTRLCLCRVRAMQRQAGISEISLTSGGFYDNMTDVPVRQGRKCGAGALTRGERIRLSPSSKKRSAGRSKRGGLVTLRRTLQHPALRLVQLPRSPRSTREPLAKDAQGGAQELATQRYVFASRKQVFDDQRGQSSRTRWTVINPSLSIDIPARARETVPYCT